MWFWKKSKGKKKYRYSIYEKIRYHRQKFKSATTIQERRKATKNLQRLHRHKDIKKSFGNVYMVKDINFDINAPLLKARRVVLVGYDKKTGMCKVIPIYKNNNGYIDLKNFDGNRCIKSKNIFDIHINDLYEKRAFKNTTNDYLTNEEKRKILYRIK